MKNKGIIFFVFMIVIFTNVLGERGFVNEADFYFASKDKSLYDVNNENIIEMRRVFDDYREFKGINLDILMRTYDYKLIAKKKIEGDYNFIIQFDISNGNLPEFITRNLNFYWDKMYKNTNIAFDLKSDFVFSFDDKKLIIAKGINLFFKNEQLAYMDNPEYLENTSSYQNMFLEEEFESVLYDIKNEVSFFFFENKEKIKKIMTETFEKDKDREIKNLVYFEDSKKIVYSLDFDAFNIFINRIFPEFGKAEFKVLVQVENPYLVYGNEYAYVVFDVFDKEGAKKSILDAIKNHIFYKDYPLEVLNETQDIFYIELPLIYKKIYFMYFEENGESSKIVISDNEDMLEKFSNKNILANVYEVEGNKKATIDFENGFRIFEYKEKGYSIKETERM